MSRSPTTPGRAMAAFEAQRKAIAALPAALPREVFRAV